MLILLAPMEGLLDHTLRAVLTAVGGIDLAVSEFIRVTDTLLPNRAFYRIVPELRHGGRTASGTPVRPQLLGSDPICLAENAAKLADISPYGVDLNFGCPAKCVNRHRGGAVLLDEPELLHTIVASVRRAVPGHLPVTAKMRLGFEDRERMLDSARALADGGADSLVVHARTKRDGYKPPAYWDAIAQIRAAIGIPVIANGEIWTPEDYRRCVAESGTADIMLGRGMVASPALALMLRGERQERLSFDELIPSLQAFWVEVQAVISPKHCPGRLKQWLNYLRREYTEAESLYQRLRPVTEPAEVGRILDELAGRT